MSLVDPEGEDVRDEETNEKGDASVSEATSCALLDNIAEKGPQNASPSHVMEQNLVTPTNCRESDIMPEGASARGRSNVVGLSMEIGKRVRKQKRFSDDFVTLPVKRGKASTTELSFVDRPASPQRKKARSTPKSKSASKASAAERQKAKENRKAEENVTPSTSMAQPAEFVAPLPAAEPVTSGQFKIKLKPTGINRFKVTSSGIEKEHPPAKRSKKTSSKDLAFEMTIASVSSGSPSMPIAAMPEEVKSPALPQTSHLKRPRRGSAYRNWFDSECARLEVESPELLNTPNFCALMASGWKRLSKTEKEV
ncbi:hypothetical protein TTRE_0000331101 [Trichuris trichiura]|uniref:Uncharacterized protein n=1 Tax=Trichuris trichiura TaxID=36087 RepID=A0A077Z8M8_TRITR|nr:hypothetical protein TTRE_0000331101 [Trichuris trichiura]